MRNNVVATYSHDDRQVRHLIFYTVAFSFLTGWVFAFLYMGVLG